MQHQTKHIDRVSKCSLQAQQVLLHCRACYCMSDVPHLSGDDDERCEQAAQAPSRLTPCQWHSHQSPDSNFGTGSGHPLIHQPMTHISSIQGLHAPLPIVQQQLLQILQGLQPDADKVITAAAASGR